MAGTLARILVCFIKKQLIKDRENQDKFAAAEWRV
jgi:hypothetical protein